MSDDNPAMTAAHRLDKARALLLSMVAEHENIRRNGEHSWRKCRACLAVNELENNPHAQACLRELIEEYDRLAAGRRPPQDAP